jgi:FkbM family methyltransferase
MNFRIKVIQSLIKLNEDLLFYPKLFNYYKKNLNFTNPIIIDIGANKGQSIDFFRKLYPNAKIYAFEPNFKLFSDLVLKYQGLDNITLSNKGISSKNGFLKFNQTVIDETSTFEELNYSSNYLKKKARYLGIKIDNIICKSYEVEVIKISDFLKSNNINHVNIIKIDTEGHELECLKGLFPNCLNSIDLIQLENHFDDMYIKTSKNEFISKFLAENGFYLEKKIKHGFGDFEEQLFKTQD